MCGFTLFPRKTLPINLRREGDDSAGNHFAPARFAVPAALTDPHERVQAVRTLVRLATDWVD